MKKKLIAVLTGSSDAGRTLNNKLTILILSFFLLGLILDGVIYYQEGSFVLLYINCFGIVLFALNLFLKLVKQYHSQRLDIISFLYIIGNFAYTGYEVIVLEQDIAYEFMRISFLGILLTQSVSLLLPIIWTYVSVLAMSCVYILASIYTGSEHLMENIVTVPFVFIGTAFWFRAYSHFIEKTIQRETEQKEENIRLARAVSKDKSVINSYLDKLSRRIDEEGLSLNVELSELAKIVNYRLPSLQKEYEDNVKSPVNKFYRQITKAHSTLTPSEIKLSYMLLKNMRTKEIADATMRTTDSVRVLRHRLRKKLGLGRETNLVSYLKQFE